MKRNVLFLLFLVCCMSSWGQRELHYKDVTTALNVFSGKDNEAGMVFSCPTSIPLTFESSHDKVVDVYQTENKGDNTVYYIRLLVGRKYSGRKLTVIASGFKPIYFNGDLSPKELKQYTLYDPDADFVYGCYYEYRKRGADYFQKGMYAEAREVYSIAEECSDCPEDTDLKERIADIDSISFYMSEAERYIDIQDFKQALNLYLKVLTLNPNDNAVVTKRLELENQYTSDCNRYIEIAENYYNDGDYEKALPLYQKVIDLNCFNSMVASERIADIQKKLSRRKQRATAFTYQWGSKTPIGFSIGRYRNRKVGGYFSLSFHPDIFHAMRKDYEKTKDFEADLSFGWTFKPVKQAPIWMFAGIGYTMNAAFIPELDSSDEPIEDEYSFEAYHAVSPEIGLLAKIKFLVLRYTFQYRFAASKDYDDIIDKTQHSVGIGICW